MAQSDAVESGAEEKNTRHEALAWRLVMTVLLLTLTTGLEQVPLPLLDRAAIGRLGGMIPSLSIAGLGIAPIVSALLTVEVAALVIPRWRHLRVSGPVARQRLVTASWKFALILAAFQGFGVSMYLEELRAGATFAFDGFVMTDVGWGPRLLITITLVAATVIFLLLAAAIERYGIGGGLSLLVGWEAVRQISAGARSALESDLTMGAVYIAACTVVVLAFAQMLPKKRSLPRIDSDVEDEPSREGSFDSPSAYQEQSARRGTIEVIRALPCGIVPVAWATAWLNLPYSLSIFSIDLGWLRSWLNPETPAYRITLLVGVVTLVLPCAFLFQGPKRVAELWSRRRDGRDGTRVTEDAARSALLRVGVSATIFLGAVQWFANFAADVTFLVLDVVSLAVVSAVVLDLAAEWKARLELDDFVPIWPIHRVYALEFALEILHQADIRAYARSQHHRALLQFFGPHVPISICVQQRDAKRARKILKAGFRAD